MYSFNIGGGNYTFKARLNELYGENTSVFREDVENHDVIIYLQ